MPFAPLATTWCSDAETYNRSEPRVAGMPQYVSTNRTHTREARGLMRVRGPPDRATSTGPVFARKKPVAVTHGGGSVK